MNLLPRDEKFFDLFHQHAQILCRASKLLLAGLRGGDEQMDGACDEIKRLEHLGDEVIHELFRKLQATFITPFDPEDIQTLATALDDVLDAIEDVAFRIVAYRLNPAPAPAIELAEIIDASCSSLARAVESLRDKKPVLADCIEVHRLENKADEVERTLVRNLFSSEIDPISLIKHKELYELLEATTDRCEDVADVIQNVAVKNS
jgi:predicted phosphate transport protein (TIGR00153 family)